MNSNDNSIKELADQYNREMGSLAADYISFKSKYNMANKIIENTSGFQTEGRSIIGALKKRIEKEDSGLYLQIKERNIS